MRLFKCFIAILSFSVTVLSKGQENGCVDFINIGDWGAITGIGQLPIAEAMAKYADENPVDFVLTSGDNFYPDGVESATDEQFDSKWRDVYNQPSLKELTWYISVGNHDYGLKNGNEWFQIEFGRNESRWYFPDLWYTFEKELYNNKKIKFIVLDSQAFRAQENNPESQTEFLKSALENKEHWTFVIAHHPVYSAGRHGPIQNTIKRDILQPIADDGYNVDLFITGHDHNLQHLKFMNNTNTEFIVNGAGGAFPYFLDEDHVGILQQEGITLEKFEDAFGFLAVHVCENEVTLKFVDDDGNINYTYVKAKP
ncbi:DgyrCDS7093 [Dimorphilus gyrociliatus]|uniref:DgyrCDS7093 n=1 Tax=Dimorphilus gyrociliatus TaxID=2664684 RepID=A0A7I8VQ73_9ANNE|nr:DgyrCDS7093 [Dimorphilus gyrociliatus]